MSIKVPIYQTQTSRVTPQISTPQELRPPEAAFGGDVAKALQNLGETGQKIAGVIMEHGLKLQQEKQDEEALNIETTYRQDMQNRVYDDTSETVKIGNQDVERPKGFLNRELGQAEGATQEFDKLYFEKGGIRDQYLTGLSNYQMKKLAPALDNYATSLRDNIIQHEAKQRSLNFKNITEANVAQKTLDASTIRDPKSLGLAINDAVDAAKSYNSRFDEATRKINNEKITGDIIESSVISTLKTTGNLTQAQSLLNGVKDKLSGDTQYNEIKDKMIKGYDTLKNQTEKIKLESKISDRFDYIGRIANGTLSWEDSPQVIRGIAIKDPQLAEAMTKVVDSKEEYFPEEANNEAYQDLVKNVFTAGSKEEVSNFLVEALDATANKEISRDRLAILVSAAQERAKSLPVNENDEPVALSPKQNEIDAGVKSIINTKNKQFSVGDMLTNFFKGIASGQSATAAHSDVVKSEINRTNPLSIKHKIGDIITNSKGESAEIVGFNDNGSPMLKRKISGKQSSNIK